MEGKIVKRRLARIVLGVCIICLISLTGCGNSATRGTDKKVQKVVLSMPTVMDVSDVGSVQDAINAITEEKYGISFVLNYIYAGNWQQQSNLNLTTDETDITVVFYTPLSVFVKNGQIEPLDRYYASAGEEFKKVWNKDELKGTTLNGTLYAIPNFRSFGAYYGFMVDEDIAHEFGLKDMQRVTMGEMDQFLRKAHAKYPERYAMAPQGGGTGMVNGWSWDGLGDDRYVGVLANRGQNTTVENLFDTKDFRELVSWTRQWYVDGLIMQDVLSTTEGSQALIANDKAIASFSNFANNKLPGVIATIVLDAWAASGAYAQYCYAINANSKAKDAAWKAMEILYTDRDVETLICNGIEGKHFVVNSDGTASYPPGKTGTDVGYSMLEQNWIPPYPALSYPLDLNGPVFYDDLFTFNAEVTKSAAMGLLFDSSGVVDQYAACLNIMDKYYAAILAGAVDTESTIAQANVELSQAGIKDVIAAKQAEVDKLLATK
jgi:putative aldouronate transport system substrate-binding protein